MWLRLDECGLLRTHVRSLWALRPAGMSTLHLLALIQSLAHQAHDDKVNAGVCLCLSVCVSQAACTTFDICCQAKIHTDTLTQTHTHTQTHTDTHKHTDTHTHAHTHTHTHTPCFARPCNVQTSGVFVGANDTARLRISDVRDLILEAIDDDSTRAVPPSRQSTTGSVVGDE